MDNTNGKIEKNIEEIEKMTNKPVDIFIELFTNFLNY